MINIIRDLQQRVMIKDLSVIWSHVTVLIFYSCLQDQQQAELFPVSVWVEMTGFFCLSRLLQTSILPIVVLTIWKQTVTLPPLSV